MNAYNKNNDNCGVPIWLAMNKIVCLLTVCSLFLNSCSSFRYQPHENIAISSTPPGAHITIDGYDCGETPQVFSVLSKYSHQISVEKAGYQPQYFNLKSHVSGRKLGRRTFIPIGLGAGGATIGLLFTGGQTSGLAGAFVGGLGMIGLGLGSLIALSAVGIDLYTGNAYQLETGNIHADFEQGYADR